MHIARVGRHRARVRLGIAALYAALVAGAVTTLYPFLLMVSTAAKSQSDYNDYAPAALVPRYWRDQDALYVKYLEDRYANNVDDLKAAHDDAPYAKVVDARPADAPDALVDHWQAFCDTLPAESLKAGFGEHENAPSPLRARFRDALRAAFDDDVARLNRAWSEENPTFDTVAPPFERTNARAWTPDTSRPKVRWWLDFKKTLPRHWLIPPSADSLWRRTLREDVYEEKIDALAAAWKRPVADWRDLTLSERPPAAGRERADWEAFVRTRLPLRLLAVDRDAEPAWRAFRARRGHAPTPMPDTLPPGGTDATDWMEFVAGHAPLTALRVDSVENRWRRALAARYATPDAANAALGTSWKRFADFRPPQAALDTRIARRDAPALRRDFATRNFRAVADHLLLHGRAALNTVLFCAFTILAALVVNPMCAYALSRYPLPYAYQVLLFLLATMAFPAEVAMIPNFLMLRDLGMLNTFWALVLPGLANGYSIFLLKGFFDSLPRELYEAAILDGARETTMFRRITAPLSLPIFSVIALNAFTGAYGAFLFALVVCQDPKMWTLMVTLYNLQATAPQYVIMAALTLAALPTLVVFLLAQKVILRGIVLPSFK